MIRTILVASILLISSVAQASFIVNMYEEDGDTLVVGSGALDLTGMSMIDTTVFSSVVTPGHGIISGRTPGIGLNSTNGFDAYSGLTEIGGAFSGGLVSVTSEVSGDSFGVFIFDLIVPHSYISGDYFSGAMIYADQTLSNLGISEWIGTYVWKLPQDTFTLIVGSKPTIPVPEPSIIALMFTGLIGLGIARRKVRKS